MKKTLLALGIAILCLPQAAYAQGAAGGLFGVKEVVVQYAHFTNPKASDVCGLTREEFATLLNAELTQNGVPSISVADAKPPMMGVARIELVPEIASVSTQELDCTSWISLTAQNQTNVHIPPVDTLRNVTVVYWKQGSMVTSGQALHHALIGDLLKKMADQFAQQYHIDQPPEIK